MAQKKSEKLLGPDYESKFSKKHSKSKESNLPVSVVAKLASINRISVYYKGTPVSDEELECKRIVDRLHTDNPTWGARQISAQLKLRGYKVGRRKAHRYMDEMGINPIYQKPNLSKRLKQAQVVPYLLRNAVIDRPNQAWSIDITYNSNEAWFLVFNSYYRLAQPLCRGLGTGRYFRYTCMHRSM